MPELLILSLKENPQDGGELGVATGSNGLRPSHQALSLELPPKAWLRGGAPFTGQGKLVLYWFLWGFCESLCSGLTIRTNLPFETI